MMSTQQSVLPVSSSGHSYNRIAQLILLSTVVVLIGGGVALLLQPRTVSHADGVSVVGPPSLPASTVNSIFARLVSPMVGTGKVVEEASRRTNIDDAFALAVWWAETNDGAAGVGLAYRNPGSVRGSVGYPSGSGGYTIYPSYSAAVSYWFDLIRHNYVDKGLGTVYAISHPYVGTSNSPAWAAKVTNLMLRYRGEAPPNIVKPSPTISPYILSMLRKHQRLPRMYLSALPPAFKEHARPSHAPPASQFGWNVGAIMWTPTLDMIVTALLAAFLIAIYGFWLRRAASIPIPMRTTSSLLPVVDFVLATARNPSNAWTPLTAPTEPVTDALGSYDTAGSQAYKRNTEVPLRRVILLPAYPESLAQNADKEAVPVAARPTGLLSRYGGKTP